MCSAFLDLRKAFDSLDHVLLLRRLQSMGVHGTEITWFTDYLTNRMQRVKSKGSFSSWISVRGGIPQGSTLGPLLFLVYVNDMPSLVQHGNLLQFADDTTLICCGDTCDDVQRQLAHDLELVSKWITFSKMQLNINKSSVMWFSSKHSKRKIQYPPVALDNRTLRAVTQQRYLGITFDCCLRWDAHVSDVCHKASYYLYLIGSSHKCLPATILKQLMESLVLSRINYALPVWRPPLLSQQVGRLQRIQNRAVRMVSSLRKFDHVSVPRRQLGWTSIPQQVKILSLAAFHHHYFDCRCLQLKPSIMFGRSHDYHTRCKQYYANSSRCQLSRTQQYFRHSAASWWNTLPFEVTCKHEEFVSLV